MASIAARRGIKVFRGVAEALPFHRSSFDLVIMVTVICFFPDPFQALAEATRVLKPSGQILIGMIDKDSPLGQSYERHKQESEFYRQARFYSVIQAVEWLEKLDFKKIEVCQTIFKDLHEINEPEPVKDGHGAGGFAVIAASRT